jgi:hypothetical protein
VTVDVVPVTLVGLKVTVTPAGAPVAASATAPVKFVRVVVRALVPCAPCCTLNVAGFSARAIAGTTGAVTVSESVAVWFETPVPLP